MKPETGDPNPKRGVDYININADSHLKFIGETIEFVSSPLHPSVMLDEAAAMRFAEAAIAWFSDAQKWRRHHRIIQRKVDDLTQELKVFEQRGPCHD